MTTATVDAAADMPKAPKSYSRLVELLAEVTNLAHAGSVLFWDQQTMMPKGGAKARGSQMAALNKVRHEKFTSPEIGRLLEDLRDYEVSLPYDSDEAATIRVARREYEKATRVPPELVARLSEAGAEGLEAWLQAREARDYKIFRPALEKTVQVMREVADALGYEEHPLDALVDQTEPGLKTADIDRLFAELREGLVPLVRAIAAKAGTVDDSFLHQPFDRDKQVAAAREAVRAIGFDLETRGRMDFSVHPYTIDMCPDDVRITTRVNENFLNTCFFACLHEAGHGLYGQGIPSRFAESILGDGASAGLHESQSRLWENLVGRSRAFWRFFYPRLQAYFPAQLGPVPLEAFYRAVNKVQPSFIRVEADEVTYNLHIMVRWELEKAVFDGRLAVKDLAEAWNAKFREYLGLEPPDDLVGVLQDIHWTTRFGAAFTSYTIGNVASVQLYDAAAAALGGEAGLAELIGRGEFAPLREWTNRNVHAWGAKLRPQELLEKVTGRPLDVGPYLAYIRRKFGGIYSDEREER